MKKFFAVIGIVAAVVTFSNCNPSKKSTSGTTKTTAVAKSTYVHDAAPLIMTHCSPCHIPAKGGNKKAYDNYANVKTDIDDIIRRIEMHPGEKGFMPFKHDRLPDSVIAAFKKFRDDGLVQQ